MPHRAAFVLLAALPLAFAHPHARTEIRFAPAEGLALRKTLRSHSEQSLDSSTVTVGGEEQEQAPDQEQTTKTDARLVVLDRYLARDGERVTKLARQFEEFTSETTTEASFDGEGHAFSGEASCELVNHEVVFAWNAESEEYEASSEDEGVESDALAELEFELDFVVVLPEEEVEVGDEWPIEVEGLRALLRFDEGLPIEWTHRFDGEEQDASEGSEEAEEDENEEATGDVTAKLEELREVDGRSIAVIRLAGEYEVATHASQSVEGEHTQTTVSDSTLTVEIEGELLWDLAGGHFRSCTLEGETSYSMSSESTLEFGEESMTFEQETTMSGSLEYSAEFEAAE